jgi:hypothetical protein
MKATLKIIAASTLLSTILMPFSHSAEALVPPPKEPSAVELRQMQTQLNQAEAKWRKTQPQHYAYTLQRSCFCPPEFNKPIMVRVFKGRVQQATLLPDNTPLPNERRAEAYPLDRSFKVIQEAIKRKASSIKVSYDKKYGFPTSISIDYSTMIADEEFYLTIKDFKVASGLKPAQVK